MPTHHDQCDPVLILVQVREKAGKGGATSGGEQYCQVWRRACRLLTHTPGRISGSWPGRRFDLNYWAFAVRWYRSPPDRTTARRPSSKITCGALSSNLRDAGRTCRVPRRIDVGIDSALSTSARDCVPFGELGLRPETGP